MSKRLLILVVVSALLAGCGGGGSGSVSPSASGSVASSSSTPSPSSGASKAPTEQIAIHLKIDPSATTASNKRHAQYVSPATNGVLVQVYTSPKSANPTPIGASATDVSPGSAACGGATGTRTCTIYIPAPAGTDDFVFTTYDQPPIAGTTTFPAGANILSIGEVTQTITLAGTNTVNAALGGVITSLAVMPVTQSSVAGTSSNYTLAITASDADGNAIVSGSTDPYNNPVTVSASEIGGSGFTSLTLGGPSGTGSSSVTVAQSSQTVTVLYSGGGAVGYGAQFAVTSQGVPAATASFDPFFVSSTSPYYTAATPALSFSAPGQTATINLAEYGFTGTFAATAGASCANVATVSSPATGATSSATVTAGANAGPCTVTFSDGSSSVPVAITTQYTSSTITIPGLTIREFPVTVSGGTMRGITAGPDGNLWFTVANTTTYTGQVGKMTTTGAVTEYPVNVSQNVPQAITVGPDGNLWYTIAGYGSFIGRITTSGSNTYYAAPSAYSYPSYIVSGPGGLLWFGESGQAKIGSISTSGTYTEYADDNSSSGIAVGSDGNLWIGEPSTNEIGRMTPTGSFTPFTVPTASSFPQQLVLGPDGNVWFTEYQGNNIGRISTSGAITEFPIPTTHPGAWGICVGADGNLWFTELFGNKIGRITTAGAITEYSPPTNGAGPYAITPGPDGNIWFTELYANNIGKMPL